MGQNRDLSRFPNAITVLDNGNVLLNTTTDSTSGFNKVLAISNDYLPSLELRKTGTIGGARTYNLAVGNTGGFSIYDATAATDRFVITSAGNVGIGTSSPSSIVKLDILLDATAVNGFQIRTSDAGTTDGSTTANVFRTVNNSAGNWANAKYNAWDHIFTTSGSTERMRITSAGVLQMTGAALTNNPGQRNSLQPSYFGYNGVYRTLIVGSSGTDYTSNAVSLAFNVDISGNASGAFTGNGNEYIYRNTGSFITPNSSNNGYNTLMGWSTNGIITHPSQPSFYAVSNAGSTSYTGSEVIVFNTTRHNTGSHFNTSSGRFTAPITGRYLFSLNIYSYGNYTSQVVLTINGSQYQPQDVSPMATAGASTAASIGFTVVFELSAGDYVEPRVRAGATAQIYRAHSHFTGHLIG
jgi:hypothetical protein